MFQNKKHLFFDLDHTLWDYESNSEETLTELWNKYKISGHGVDLNGFIGKFTEINEKMWDDFHVGLIDKDTIRQERFPSVFKALNIDDTAGAETMQVEYINVCPTKPHLVDGVADLLSQVSEKYELHIITNGFDEIQSIKLKSGAIDHYFKEIISSGLVGFRKPDKRIFDYALEVAGAQAGESLMIGDNPVSDIKGAQLAGIDQVFYNPNGLACPVTPTLEIKSMKELLEFL
jgi:putative hydrolase of the HAD superfamily